MTMPPTNAIHGFMDDTVPLRTDSLWEVGVGRLASDHG